MKTWWWIPVLAVVGLLLKAALLTPWIAGKSEDAAVGALQGDGLSSVDFVEVSGVDGIGANGLNVVLEGPPGDEVAAVAVVEGLDEVDSVVYRPVGAALPAVEAADDEPVEVEEVASPPVDLAAAALTASVSGDAVLLTGTVADDATRDAVVSAAESEFGAENVTNELEVDGDAVAADGGVVTVTGEAASDEQQAGWLVGATAAAGVVGFEVVDESTVRSIEASLNDLFELEPIEFDSNRATIRPASVATLDAAAELINANPDVGQLRIIGHTDSDGSSAANLQLSAARAEAVQTYLVDTGGVSGDRLLPEGRGEDELLVEPESSQDDKQRNRRIEWELVTS